MTLQLGNAQSLDLQGAVNNFLNAFYGAKANKMKEKDRKLQPQIDFINHIAKDPDMPLDSKIKAIDILPHILGTPPKDGISLSRHIGLDQVAEQMVTTKQGTPAEPDVLPIKKTTVIDPNTDQDISHVVAQNDSRNIIEQQGQIGKAEVLAIKRRRGELSANELKELKQEQLIEARDESSFSKQLRLADYQAKVHEEDLNKQGWEKNGDWFLDNKTNRWSQVWFNPRTHESQTQTLNQGAVPLSLIQTQVKSGGPTAALRTLIPGIAAGMGLPEDNILVIQEASKILGDLTKSKEKFYGQRIAGTTATDVRGNEGLKITKRKEDRESRAAIAQIKGQLTDATHEANVAKTDADAYEKKVIAPLEKQMKDWLDPKIEGGDVGDPEYRAMQDDMGRYQAELARLRGVQRSYEGKAKGHKDRLDEIVGGDFSTVDNNSNTQGASTKGDRDAKIRHFMERNPNVTDYAEAERILIRARRIPPK